METAKDKDWRKLIQWEMFKPRSLKASNQEIQETSTTTVSQPTANKTSLLKQPHWGANLNESTNMSIKKKIQTSLNV